MNPFDKISVVAKSLLIHLIPTFLIISLLIFLFSRVVWGLFVLFTNPFQHPFEFTVGVAAVGAILFILIIPLIGMVLTARYTSSHIKDTSSIRWLYGILSGLLYIIIIFFFVKLIIPYIQSPLRFVP